MLEDAKLRVAMRLLDVLLDESKLFKPLGMGSRESLEHRWIQVKLQLELELVEAGRRESLECR